MSDDLEAEVRRLRREVEELRSRVEELEQRAETDHDARARDSSASSEPSAAAVDVPDAHATAEDAADDAEAVTVDDAEATTAGETKAVTVDDAYAATADETEATTADDADAATADDTEAATADDTDVQTAGTDWERDVGTRWLAIAGAAALVLGVVFFVQVAIDRGLIGPLARVAVGTVGGLALFALGRFVAERQGYRRWGTIAAGAGFAIAYVSVYAAYGFESYRSAIGTPLWATLLGLTLLVGGAAALSIRERRPVVGGEAFLLGYATAFLALDAGATAIVPVYALLLSAGLVVASTLRPWRAHLAASVAATYGVLWLWAGAADPEPLARIPAFVAAFLAYVAGSYVLATGATATAAREPADAAAAASASSTASRGPWPISVAPDAIHETDDVAPTLPLAVVTILNGTAGAFGIQAAALAWRPETPADGVAVAAVGAALLVAYAATDRRAVVRDEAAGALGVLLVGASAVVAAGASFAATAGLLAVLVVAAVLADARDATALRTGAHAVTVVAAYKLLVVDLSVLPALDPGAPLAAATSRAAAFALAIATFYTLSRWWTRTPVDHLVGVTGEPPIPAAYAWTASTLAVVLLTLVLSGLGVSVAWALFGLALVGVGLARAARDLRVQGIAVLGLATGKVFLVDTSDLGLLARTASFLALGAVLLAASYAYARWQGEDPLESVTDE